MKKRMLLFGSVFMLAVLTACGSNGKQKEQEVQAANGNPYGEDTLAEYGNPEDDGNSAAYEYEGYIIRYGEISEKFSFRKDVEKTMTSYAVYCFEPSVSEQERQACIAATDRALSGIDDVLPELEIAVFTGETFDGVAVSGNRLYTSIQSWDSAEYLAGVLLAAYGEWGNYGLAYGYADYLCRKAGTGNGESDSEGRWCGGFLTMSSPELYDLNLLCFNERFVSAEDVEAAKNNACCFVNDYLSSHTDAEFLELLSASGTAEGVGRTNEALEAFYEGNGVKCDLTEIRYQFGGVTLDYAAACEYARFYLEKDWQDMSWEDNPMVSEHFLHEDYGEVRAFLECNVRQMEQYQERFGFDSYNNNLSVLFANRNRKPLVSLYYGATHAIWLETVVSLSHEYIHSLMFVHCEDWESRWRVEGFARYYDRLYNDYAYDLWNYSLNCDDAETFYASQEKSYLNAYIEHIGRPIDSENQTDYHDLLNFLTYVYGWKDPNCAYESGASFLDYLINQYGEEAVMRYVCSYHEYNSEWGKTYEALVQDWNAYIEENYAWYDRGADRNVFDQ